jgi:hypothetical protein
MTTTATTLLAGGVAPAARQLAAAVAPLPAGWKEAKAPDGRTYVFAFTAFVLNP